MVLGALLLVSLLPIGLYHRQVLKLSQQKLADTERVQQTEVTRSLAEEVQLFESNLHQQLISQRQILALTGLIEDVDDPVRAPQVTRIVHVLDQSSQRKNLPLADQLLVEIRFKELDLFGQRAGDFGLLDAFGVRQLLLAELQYLPVVQPDGQQADKQQGAQHHPEDARATQESRLESFDPH